MRCVIATALLLAAAACSFGTVLPSSDEDEPTPAPPDSSADATSETTNGDGGTATGNGDGKPDAAGPRYVFVTSQAYPGDLGGLAGADDKCQTLADASAFPGVAGRTFRAWLSDTNKAAADRFTANGPFARVDETPVANDWNAFVNGPHLAEINVDERGIISADDEVWTGTQADGTGTAVDCEDWKNTALVNSGTVGSCSKKDETWTDARTFACNASARLYCIQIAP